MKHNQDCRIVCVGKRRDGRLRYWCLAHHADATAKYGKRAKQCRYAHIPQISPHETLTLDPSLYEGGVAIWGAVPPLYDTTRNPTEHGVHVHARHSDTDSKVIDGTFRSVRLIAPSAENVKREFIISELDAIYHMASSLFGFQVKHVQCTLCGFEHLDKDWFSVHAHRRHLCAGCGREFRDNEASIGNPIAKVRDAFRIQPHSIAPASKDLDLEQRNYPGGIQIWGSNPAILWTANKNEETGIHIHAFDTNGTQPTIDETFRRVRIDGIRLEPTRVRTLMAQTALPHISGRVVDISCPECGNAHFDTGPESFRPHDEHTCPGCKATFRSPGRFRKTIGNPAIRMLAALTKNAVRTPQVHEACLLPETL
jgi:transposase-like protein